MGQAVGGSILDPTWFDPVSQLSMASRKKEVNETVRDFTMLET
jgi:hypothetical protein